MAASERWYFDLEQIHNTPSIKCGYDHDKELSCRQQAANFIQDMGQRLQVNQLCINTAIVYMHRFYMFHSFTRFHRTSLASASLFLAAKVEEQPRKLEHVIRFAQICLHREQNPFDINSQSYLEQVQDLIMNENILLQTLGFDVAIDHPHTHIVRCCQLVRASKDLAQTSYFMASYSLHLTTMCLQYKPTVVACFCIHLACKWSNWEIPESSEGKSWFWYVDKSVTSELLEDLTAEFLNLFEKCPSRLKRKIMALSSYSNIPPIIANSQPAGTQQQELDKRKDNRLAIESHNPMNSVPHPIGPLAIAVAEATAMSNSLTGAGTGQHPFMHQNPMVARHSNSEDLLKKRHYDHNQRSSAGLISVPPPSMPDPPYKKHHHPPPHHQRDTHGMPLPSSSSKPSCMFDVGSLQHGQPPVHKPSYSHGSMPSSGHINPPVHPAAVVISSSARNINKMDHVSPGASHRPQSSRPAHVRNGEAHLSEKKYPEVKKEVAETKPVSSQMLAPPAQIPMRVRPKTPPQQLNLTPQMAPQLPVKVERSIFSPEEKAISPPPRMQQEKVRSSPPSTPRTPVDVERPSPEAERTLVQAQPQLPQQLAPTRQLEDRHVPSSTSPPTTTPVQPDTPSKSSHKKKKKKHKDHKDKHKDKHKHKHKVKDPEPIVITIPKDKITISHPEGLKIKIAKEKISNPSSGLKLKISKDKLKETKKRERSDGEEEDLEQRSKQHRPNGTTALQVKDSNNPFSSVLGKSLLSPIRTPAHISCKALPHHSSSEDESPISSPVQIPKYSPTESGTSKLNFSSSKDKSFPGTVRTPGHSPEHEKETSPEPVSTFVRSPTKPCLSPIPATPRYCSPKHHSSPNSHSSETTRVNCRSSPAQPKPFLAPTIATPKNSKKNKRSRILPPPLPPQVSACELSSMSPMRSKPFLSPIAPTPRYPSPKPSSSPPPRHCYVPLTQVSESKTFLSPIAPTPRYPSPKNSSSPPQEHCYIPMTPITESKPFLSPIAPTPRHPSPKRNMSPPPNHCYIPLTQMTESKPFLSPIAPTPRYPSPKRNTSPGIKHRYVPLTNTAEPSSPTSSSHSSPNISDCEDEVKDQAKTSQTPQSLPRISNSKSRSVSMLNPEFTDGNCQDKKDKKSARQAYFPLHRSERADSEVYSSPPGESETFTYITNKTKATHLDSDKNKSPIYSQDKPFTPKYEYDKVHSPTYDSGIDSTINANVTMSSDSGSDIKYNLNRASMSNRNSNRKKSKSSVRLEAATVPDHKNETLTSMQAAEDSLDYKNAKSFAKVTKCLSPLMTPRYGTESAQCISPIMTPGRSPVDREVNKAKSVSPVIIPRYSPTDPNNFRTNIRHPDYSEVNRNRNSEKTPLPKGPHTPPGPRSPAGPSTPTGPRTPPSPQTSSYLYNPITPLRPDPNEIIFKDSNDNHMKQPLPTPIKRPPDKRYGGDRQRRTLLPDFKIPRMHMPNRRVPQESGNPWGGRGRGRIGHAGYSRMRGCGQGRGRGRWDPTHYRHPRPPTHHNDSRQYYHSEEHNTYHHSQEVPHRHLHRTYDSSPAFQGNAGPVLQGNAYDSAVMKLAFESMGIHSDGVQYYMQHYPQQNVYIPSYPPPPPLPDEPPPPQPPPPPS